MEPKSPWTKFYGKVPKNLVYPEGTICDALWSAAEDNRDSTAIVYFNRRISYGELQRQVLCTMGMLSDTGVKKGDRVLVCLPNIPQAVYLLYALDRMGAEAVFAHPRLAREELVGYVKISEACCIVALCNMRGLVEEVASRVQVGAVLYTSPADELRGMSRLVYRIRSADKPCADADKSYRWSELKKSCTSVHPERAEKTAEDTGVILFSGGTTGEPKGVMLSGRALNAMATQTARMSAADVKGKSMLAAMPVFHGFGLCVCVHTVLIHGGVCVLVPTFSAKGYAQLIRKHRPSFIAGVPTLFEALLREPKMKHTDLGCLEGAFCGGDALPEQLKKRFDAFLREHKASISLRQGYGATECVTASCLTPACDGRQGSIGIPFPDTFYKICKAGTEQELGYNAVGEICISGPALMKGYLGDKKETAKVLRRHSDGRLWLHTGDAGSMDEDGFVYFSHRLKRVIISGGYNVYPQIVERAIQLHPCVSRCCVAGVKDEYKIERVKAYVVANTQVQDEEKFTAELMEHLKGFVARYALPSCIEIVRSLPLSRTGKVDYTRL